MFGQTVLAELPSSMRAQSPNETRSVEAAFVHSGLDTGPVVQGAVRIDGELVLKRFVARNVKPITPIVWNQIIGDQLFSAIASTRRNSHRVLQMSQDHCLMPMLSNLCMMMMLLSTQMVLLREMKEPDPGFRAPMPKKRPVESAPSQPRKPGELKIARQDPIRASTAKDTPCPACDSGMDVPGIRHNAECKRKRVAFEASETPIAMPDVVPNVGRSRLEVRHEDMEVETENGPTPVGAGSDEVGLSMDTEGSGMKREAEQSVEDLEDEMAAERAAGTQVPMTLDLFSWTMHVML